MLNPEKGVESTQEEVAVRRGEVVGIPKRELKGVRADVDVYVASGIPKRELKEIRSSHLIPLSNRLRIPKRELKAICARVSEKLASKESRKGS